MATNPRSFAQARVRRHRRRGPAYDPEAEKKNPLYAVVALLSVLALGAAGWFVYSKMSELAAEERARKEAPEASRKLLEDLKRFRAMNSGDDRIDVVRLYVEERKDKLIEGDRYAAEEILRQLRAQKEQAAFQAKLNSLLNDVRSMRDQPEHVETVRKKVIELRAILQDGLDDDRAASVKQEIFVALGRSAIASARGALKAADRYAEEHPGEFLEATLRFEKADEELASMEEASRLPETKELRNEITRRIDAVALKWSEATRGFEAVAPRNLLDPSQFATKPGDEKPPWQTSPGAKLTLEGGRLLVEGVVPERATHPGERAGLAFWSPGPKTAIRHYELRARVRIVKAGFTLVARQSTGYMRHTFGFETKAEGGSGASTDVTFVPDEGTTYEITERVFGRKVKIEIFSTKEDDAAIAPVEDSTAAREGGIAIQVRRGAAVEFERLEIRILR